MKHYSDWVTKWQENLYFKFSVHESVRGVTVHVFWGVELGQQQAYRGLI